LDERSVAQREVVLRGITWDHPRGYAPMEATAGEFAARRPSARIVWEKRPLAEFGGKPVEQLARDFDLIVMDHPHVGDAARAGCLVALDDLGRDQELAQLAARSVGPSHTSYQFDGHQWALAIDAAAQVAAYRPDLLSHPPARWADVVALAEDGRVLWPLRSVADALLSFCTLAANAGTPIADEHQWLLRPDDADALLTAMTAVARYVPRACLDMDPIQALEELSTGDTYAYAPLLFGYTNYARTSYRPRLIRFADMPALGEDGPRGSTLGGAGLAISARCRERERAAAYVFWVASAECQAGLYVRSGGQPAHAAAWDDPAANGLTHSFFRDTRATHERAWVRPRFPGFLTFRRAGGEILGAYLAGHAGARATALELEKAFVRCRASTSVR
jgi:multiple sugar transport system substrate-binding protein